MTDVWETEYESPGPASSMPDLSRSASRGSRKSRRSRTPPGKKGKSRSPPPVPGEKSSKRQSREKDAALDESISILDPRRFTPTLHASLVSEILSLRRDQEEKLKLIESLESSLHAAREESEALQASLSSMGKESRSLKRQLSLLEGGTSSAFAELAKERDEAVELVNETRKRLETTQKKLKSLEEDSDRVHKQWAKEKEEWEEEKRKLDRRVHVAETRLKAVLEEVAAFQAAQAKAQESDGEESVKGSDTASVRTLSLTNSIRFSVAASMIKANGASLADELGNLDEDSDYGGRESVLSNGTNFRHFSRDSFASRHQRQLSSDSVMRVGSVTRGKLVFNPAALEKLESAVIKKAEEPAPRPVYVDTGIQYSPPPSPKASPVSPKSPVSSISPLSPPKPATPPEKTATSFVQRVARLFDVDSPPRSETPMPEVEANQRKKRVHIGHSPLAIKAKEMPGLMVNGSCQTIDEPLSPPKTPRMPVPFQEPTPAPTPVPTPKAEMVSASTQTEDVPVPLTAANLAMGLPIPTISIIPPSSRPSTPGREHLLPPLCKDFGCQVSLPAVPYVTSGMQTEEIRVDLRLAKLPPHLHPSAIKSRPSSPAAEVAEGDETKQFSPVPGNLPPRNPRRLATKRSFTSDAPVSPPLASPASIWSKDSTTHDMYPGNNDDGPLSSHVRAPIRRPPRISSLFAGFGDDSDDGDEFLAGDADVSDSEWKTALSAPRPQNGSVKAGKRSSMGSVSETLSPKAQSARFVKALEDLDSLEEEGMGVARRSSSRRGRGASMLTSGGANRMSGSYMRKTALIQNGIATHARARSPSLTDHAREPPFPIPQRASSRAKPPVSWTAPAAEVRTPSRGSDAWTRRSSIRSHYRAGSIRKARTAGIGVRTRPRRRTSRSPPPFSPAASSALESPGLPPMMSDYGGSLPATRDGWSRWRGHRSQPSTTTATTGDTGSASHAGSWNASGGQPTTVVDAIAQTMVGEWMFKYVRRRKSFSVGDGNRDDSSNDRHRRWVWLAPYERAILWSSKQPTSNNALLGKAGRKLAIQSVLDVKDDNPPPKGAGPLFNRSILILTPQRALKFTAVSAERHYIWLTALSFLAHSNQAIPETLALPLPQPYPASNAKSGKQQERKHQEQQVVPPPPEYELPKPKRRPIRDSIRLTKAKAGFALSHHHDKKAQQQQQTVHEQPLASPAIPPPEPSPTIDSAPPSIPTYRPPMPDVYQLPAHARDMSRDAAEPPSVPRFLDRTANLMHYHSPGVVHGRKRSNTGGHIPPPLSFRGFSGPMGGGTGYHTATNSTAGSEVFSNSGSLTWGTTGTGTGTGSLRTVDTFSSRNNTTTMNSGNGNMFDAVGTVRMEAFISPLSFSRYDHPEPLSPYSMSMSATEYGYESDFTRLGSSTLLAHRRSREWSRRAGWGRGAHVSERKRDSYQSKDGDGEVVAGEWFVGDPFGGF